MIFGLVDASSDHIIALRALIVGYLVVGRWGGVGGINFCFLVSTSLPPIIITATESSCIHYLPSASPAI